MNGGDLVSTMQLSALSSGAHQDRRAACAMEAASYIAGEAWSDHPACVSPVIATFLRSWNDEIRDDARRTHLLAPLLPLVLGTKGTKAHETTRAWMCVDWQVRVQAPAWMRLVPALRGSAEKLAGLPPLTSAAVAKLHQRAIDGARSESNAARDAAWAAARDAAWDAAWDAARAAARDAAWAAARDALAPTVVALQESAQQLVRDMCAVHRVETPIKRGLVINGFTFEPTP